MPKRVSGPHVSVILTMPHSMRSRVYVTVRCPSVCLSVPLHQCRSRFDTVRSQATALRQYGCRSTALSSKCGQRRVYSQATRAAEHGLVMSAYLYVTHSDVCIGNSRPTLIVLHDKNRLSDLQSMFDTFFSTEVYNPTRVHFVLVSRPLML